MTPEEGLKHPWISRNKIHSLFKENENMTKMFIMKDLESIMKPMPVNKK